MPLALCGAERSYISRPRITIRGRVLAPTVDQIGSPHSGRLQRTSHLIRMLDRLLPTRRW